MICPMMFFSHPNTLHPELSSLACFEEKCAWWIPGLDGCAIRGIFMALSYMESGGVKIVTKPDRK